MKAFLLSKSDIEKIVQQTNKTQLDYFEYTFLSEEQLRLYLRTQLRGFINKDDSIFFVVKNSDTILGTLSLDFNTFDSEMLNMRCYKMDLKVFSNNTKHLHSIIDLLMQKTEDFLRSQTGKSHLFLSLNNNTYNHTLILNYLVTRGFFYIHTLLTFSNKDYTKQHANSLVSGLKIRQVKSEDAKEVIKLAGKSFNFSRFHLDPFIDNIKANKLLKVSAKNSIMENFADVMFIAEKDGKVIGYYSGKKTFVPEFDKTIGNAIISAVDSNYRGLGVFSMLDDHLLDWFSNNSSFAEMGTYLINYPIHKTWINKSLSLIRGMHQLSKLYT